MILLRRVLWFKILFTILAWALPFLLLPKSMFQPLLGYTPEPLFLIRLLGWAYFALVVGYSFGLRQIGQQIFPWGTVIMGLFSNGGAALLLMYFLLMGDVANHTGLPVMLLWASCAALLLITLGLSVSAFQFSKRVDKSKAT